MKRKRIEVVFVAALFAAALAFVACKNIEDGGEIQQPPAPEQGASGGSQGEGQPGSGDNTGNEGENPDEGGDEGDEQTPPQPSGKTVVELLKEIIKENEYDAISAEVAAGNMTLTEEKIKAVGDIFPALEKDAESGKEAKDVENAAAILQNKEAFIAQNEGKINITKSGSYTLNSYNVSVIFNGEFNLDEISLPANNGKGDFSNATLMGNNITIDNLNSIRGEYLPTISSTNISSRSSPKAIYNLYKAYSDKLDNLKLSGNLYRRTIDGKEISGRSDYTLFTDDNTAKLSTNTSIISLSADALAQMTNQLTIYNIRNMIISGNAKTNTVNWQLTNIVFEGDMSNLKNNFTHPEDNNALSLYGIIYFKNKPYNNNVYDGQSVKGMVKLDNLQGVSNENLKVAFSSQIYNILDVSGVNTDSLDKYNPEGKEIISRGGSTHAIYFHKDYDKSGINDTQTEINKLCYKFTPEGRAGIVNVYLGAHKVKGNYYNTEYGNNNSAASRIPRTLKEFEYFGDTLRFEKSAKSSYDKYLTDWGALDKEEQDRLMTDEGENLIAQNNRKCFSCVAKSFV